MPHPIACKYGHQSVALLHRGHFTKQYVFECKHCLPVCQAAEALGITLPGQATRKRKLVADPLESSNDAGQSATVGLSQLVNPLGATQPAQKKAKQAVARLPPLPGICCVE